jgi:hypothetical protein
MTVFRPTATSRSFVAQHKSRVLRGNARFTFFLALLPTERSASAPCPFWAGRRGGFYPEE